MMVGTGATSRAQARESLVRKDRMRTVTAYQSWMIFQQRAVFEYHRSWLGVCGTRKE